MRSPGVPRLRAASRNWAAASCDGCVIERYCSALFRKFARKLAEQDTSTASRVILRAMHDRLTPAATLPIDRERALLVGRAWVPAVDGAVLVAVQGDDLVDLSRVAPTSSALMNLADPAAAVRAAGTLPPIASVTDVLANSA